VKYLDQGNLLPRYFVAYKIHHGSGLTQSKFTPTRRLKTNNDVNVLGESNTHITCSYLKRQQTRLIDLSATIGNVLHQSTCMATPNKQTKQNHRASTDMRKTWTHGVPLVANRVPNAVRVNERRSKYSNARSAMPIERMLSHQRRRKGAKKLTKRERCISRGR
jgi:hypothetical protein